MERQLKGIWERLFFWVAMAYAVFQLYGAGFGFLPDVRQRAVHLLAGLCLALVLFSYKKRAEAETKPPLWELALIGVVVICNINIFLAYFDIYIKPFGTFTRFDFVLGCLMVLVLLEASRRVYGWVIPGMVAGSLLFLFISPHLTGIWSMKPLPLDFVLIYLYYSPDGIFGFLTGLSATLIAIFLIFGSLLMFTGMGENFITISSTLAGRYRGGPAKVAVIASAMFGTISGSAVANTAVTGNYTIPLMKKLGYKPHFAGGVEAVASSGGMITPPIMGSGAFVMSELIAVPYIMIIYYALFPAFLFYTSLFSGVHLEALRLGLVGIPKEEVPSWRTSFSPAKIIPFMIPIILLLYLLIQGWSITYAGFVACMAILGLFFFVSSDYSFAGFTARFRQVGRGLSAGGQSVARICILLASMGVLIAVLSMSGVTVKLSGLITDLGEVNMIVGVLTAAIVPLILGMAVPPVAAYVISAAICAPALLHLGIGLVQAHLFLFYISCLAPFTPPICAAAFVAAGIAQTNWLKLAFVSMRLGLVAYIVPFLMIWSPEFLGMGDPLQILLVVSTAALGATFMAAGSFGYLLKKINMFTRLAFLAGGILLFVPGWQSDVLGLLICGLVAFIIYRAGKVVNIG